MRTISRQVMRTSISNSLSPSLGLDLPQVELELLALQHIPVRPSALSGTGRDGSKHTTGHELIKKSLFNLALLLPLSVLGLGLLRPLLVDCGLLSIGELSSLLSSKRQSIVGLVPLSEGCGIDDYDGVLHESFGSDQLVVTGIVDNINNPGLAGNGFRTPH